CKKPRVITAGRSSCSCKRHISPRPLRPAIAETLAKLRAEKRGLSDVEVQARLTKYGPNALVEKQKSALAALLVFRLRRSCPYCRGKSSVSCGLTTYHQARSCWIRR